MEHRSLDGLNEAQRDAVIFKDGYELILAGAGTGKTKTLTSHVAWLLEEGIDPGSILMVTFTNAAADEMKQRIINFAGEKGEEITAVTFHSLCYSILKQNEDRIGMPYFTLMDDQDSKDVFDMCIEEEKDELQLKGISIHSISIPKSKNLQDIKARSVYDMRPLSDVVRESRCDYDQTMEVFAKYEQMNHTKHRMDFDDLLLNTYNLLINDEEIRSMLDDRYRYIMVDEYQDTDQIQDAILHLLTKDYSNLVVVGDENQSIYKFRGAYIENILGFMKRHPDARKIELTTNYRSDQTILNLANAVMIYADSKDHRNLRSADVADAIKDGRETNVRQAKPALIRTENETAEVRYITDCIESMLASENVPADKIAVLCRSSKPLENMEEELAKRGIPSVIHKGSSSDFGSVIRNIMLMLRLSQNYSDDIALMDLLKGFIYKMPVTTIRQICEQVSNHGITWLTSTDNRYLMEPYGKDLFRFGEMINQLAVLSLEDALYLIIDGSFYQELCDRYDLAEEQSGRIVNRQDAKHTDQRENLKKAEVLIQRAGGFESAPEFIESLTLEDVTLEDSKESVILSTIHSAKGLEFDTVFLMGTWDGGLPLQSEIEKHPYPPEELRCMYVALTRAKRNLTITYPEKARSNPNNRDCLYSQKLSRFLDHDNVRQCMEPERKQQYRKRYRTANTAADTGINNET